MTPKAVTQSSVILFFLPLCLVQSTGYILSLSSRVPVKTFTTGSPHTSLFGPPAVTAAPKSAFAQGVHPRLIFDKAGWDDIVSKLANISHFERKGSWARYHRLLTVRDGPNSKFVRKLWELENGNVTAAYSTVPDLMNMSVKERATLAPLAQRIMDSNSGESHHLFLCALWTSVNEEVVSQRRPAFIAEKPEFCVQASVAWAKILLSHRAYCANGCDNEYGGERAKVWDYTKKYEVFTDWYTCGLSLALVYDVLYERMNTSDRKTIRSALAMIVMKRFSWGTSTASTRESPNAKMHPHRIFSNWAMYHSNLYLTNLAIEGDFDFDNYATAVLKSENVSTGFNSGLNERFAALIKAYMGHSVYPDGSTYEDGYTYTVAFREGSLGLIAAHRRGLNVLNTDRFRNLLHNAVQMSEPWRCGRLLGHSAGGGLPYPGATALFRYVYPSSPLANLLWRQRMGDDFVNTEKCRINFFQDFIQRSILGGEHGSVSAAGTLEQLEPALSKHIPLSFYAPRRGLLIARSNLEENAVYVHYDARPDAFLVGHDNADRGSFTYTAYKTTWINDPHFKLNRGSRHHSLMHVDGLAQSLKAPSVKMLRTEDDGSVVLSSADLLRAYNEQWTWHDGREAPTKRVYYYKEDGTQAFADKLFPDKLLGNPTAFGWPSGDDGNDIGFTRPEANLYGDPDLGFKGMWWWKRSYRDVSLVRAMRSTILVRATGTVGYFVVVDSFAVSGTSANHKFESYLILGDGVRVDSSNSTCVENSCKIVLINNGTARVDVHVKTLGGNLSFRLESWKAEKVYSRLVIRSEGMLDEEFWVAFHAHIEQSGRFSMAKTSTGDMKINYAGKEHFFKTHHATHEVVQTRDHGKYLSVTGSSSNSKEDISSSKTEPEGGQPPKAPKLQKPMKPKILQFRVPELLVEDSFKTEKASFAVTDAGTYQAVLKLHSKTKRNGRRVDRFRTCYSNTKARTSLFILDCGKRAVADGNYERRLCSVVAKSTSDDRCRSWKTDMHVKLQPRKPYFLVVSAERKGKKSVEVKIQHSRGRSRGYRSHGRRGGAPRW